jgi:hypothetical protein
MSTDRDKNELKIQGAFEAARDPASKVTAEDAEKKMVDEAKKLGVPAFAFDPNASTAEKRAQARAVRILAIYIQFRIANHSYRRCPKALRTT